LREKAINPVTPFPGPRDAGELFGEEYFRNYGASSLPGGAVPYGRHEPWLGQFAAIADRIVQSLRPRRVLDAGCACGLLVEALWDRGVEAYGIDISAYAIAQARRDIRPYCTVASLANPFDGRFDLVVCIEVLEHLEPAEAEAALANLCAATDTILFSSTPVDVSEPTHVNVRPVLDWLLRFAAHGFAPVADYDASFVAQHALLMRRGPAPPEDYLRLYARYVRQRMELAGRYGDVARLEEELSALGGEQRRLQEELSALGGEQRRLREAAARAEQQAQQASALASELQAQAQRLTAAWEQERERARAAAEEAADLARQRAFLAASLEGARREAEAQIAAAREESTAERQRSARALEQVLAQQAELQRLTLELSQLHVRSARLEERLFQIEGSSGWRAIVRYREWRRDFFRRGSAAERFFERLVRGFLPRSEPAAAAGVPGPPVSPWPPAEPPTPPSAQARRPAPVSKFALIVSGCPGDSFRYRAEHHAEQLGLCGLSADVALFDEVEYDRALSRYELFLFHRVPVTPAIEAFLTTARGIGKLVLFDTDDLVFDEAHLGEIRALEWMAPDERALYADGVRRYGKTLSLTMGALATTDSLAAAIRAAFPHLPVEVHRNAVSGEMVAQAAAALADVPHPDDGWVRVAYFSGTRTHHHDFAVCLPALVRLLETRPRVRLMLVGHLDLPETLRPYASRLEIIPLVPWQELPALYRRVDINLAPLEADNRFTEAKSELKYYEAGLLGVPTVASDLPSFRHAITPGENGCLCRRPEEWSAALEALVDDPALRRRMGEAARADVLERYTTRARAPHLAGALRTLAGTLLPGQRRPLSVAIVARAPIANTGGGYRTLFELGHGLARRGHQVRFYVEPIAHLEGLSVEEIRDFCRRHFGESAASVHVGHDFIHTCDVAVATNWPTAYTVAGLTNTLARVYLVQDEEQHFYEPEDPLFAQAERTYDLPLRKITVGRYLAGVFSRRDGIPAAHLDFCPDRTLFHDRGLRPEAGPLRVLFFARPGLKRRAFPVGAAALAAFVSRHPEAEIALYGANDLPPLGFPYRNLGELTREQVAWEMARSHIHLSFSLSNISWVPFEAMACGCAVVEAAVPAVAGMLPADAALLVEPAVEPVAAALCRLAEDPGLRARLAAHGRAFLDAQPADWGEVVRKWEELLYETLLLPWRPPQD